MKKKGRIFGVTGNVILCIVALLVFIPLLWLVVSSFKSNADVIRWPPAFLPKEWLTSQYEYVIEAIPILSMLKNTVVFAGSVTLVSLLFDSLAAYAFARMEFRGKNVLFTIILLTMMVPFQIIMIPLYIEEYKLGILDTLLGLILPRASGAYGIYMLTSFFSRIPKSLEEAARLDGLNNLQIYRRIVIPLSKPALISLGIYHFMNNWRPFVPDDADEFSRKQNAVGRPGSTCRKQFHQIWSHIGCDSNLYLPAAIVVFIWTEVFYRRHCYFWS